MRARDVHELALMESLVETVIERIGDDRRVGVVRLAVGRLAGVSEDAIVFGYDVATQGTTLEGSTLEIVSVAGRARCRRCASEQAMVSYASACTCGSFDREIVAGHELHVVDVEVL